MNMAVGDVKVVKFADIRQAETDLVCPSCGAKPRWTGGYDCECGQKYNHWSRLKRILTRRGTAAQNKINRDAASADDQQVKLEYVGRAKPLLERWAEEDSSG